MPPATFIEVEAALDFRDAESLLDGRALADVACPWCGPECRAPVNRRRKVLRLWAALGFISFYCIRCGESGYVRDHVRRRIDPEAVRRHRAIVAERERVEVERRCRKAQWLWTQRQPITGTIAEKYLQEVRGISCPLPSSLGYLPPRDEHPPALIAAFGIPAEPEPGVLVVSNETVVGVHITRLAPNGGAKAGTEADKIMIGRPSGAPIVLAPPNDLLGLAVTEGIEDALSVHQATGLGVWAAGSAGFMPKLTDAVPDYIEVVTVIADADETGQRNAALLAERLGKRGFHVELVRSLGMPSLLADDHSGSVRLVESPTSKSQRAHSQPKSGLDLNSANRKPHPAATNGRGQVLKKSAGPF
jgi:hypothetical protein